MEPWALRAERLRRPRRERERLLPFVSPSSSWETEASGAEGAPGATSWSSASVKLKVEDLHKSYGEHEVLKGVSLNASKGDVISLIGASGSGKSTMLRCINFLEQPDAGVITLDGISIEMRPGRAGVQAPQLLYRPRNRRGDW